MGWLVALVMLAGSASGSVDLPRKIKPVVVWTGIDSKQEKDTYARCCSSKEWQTTWDSHIGKEGADCPTIDFDSYTVIAVFRFTSRIRISEIVDENECLRVRYEPYGNQIVFVPTESGVKVFEAGRGEIHPNDPYPLSYAFVVLPKSTKAVILEEDVRRRIDRPPVWKERAKFSTIMEK